MLKTIRKNDSVDGKHFIRFRDENSVLKFIRISVDGALGNSLGLLFREIVIANEAAEPRGEADEAAES